MNRWLVLRIVVLCGALGWAVYTIQDTSPVDLLVEVPLYLTPPPDRKPFVRGDMTMLTRVLEQQVVAVAACGRKGSLELRFGKAGLEQASWLGQELGEARACVEAALWGAEWPALEQPLQLEWPIG